MLFRSVLEGGFGKGKRCLLVKDIARLHDKEAKHINELINDNRDDFEHGIDIIDLLGVGLGDHELKRLGILQQSINSTRGQNGSIYLLSDQGYFALVNLMRTSEAREVRKALRRDYFTMRESITSDKTLKALAVLKAIEGESFEAKVQGIEEYAGYKKQEGIEEGKAIGIEEGKILGEDIGIKKAINKHDENYENYGGNLFVKKLKIFIKPYGLKYQQLNTATDLNKFLVFKGYGKFVKSTERAHFKPNEEFIGLCNKNGWGECSRMETGGYRMKYSEKFMEVFIVRKVNDEYLAYLKSLIKKKIVVDEMPECPF